MWGSFLDKGKELAEKAKKAAEDLDKQLNESVGVAPGGPPESGNASPAFFAGTLSAVSGSSVPGSADDDNDDALNDENWDDDDDIFDDMPINDSPADQEKEDEAGNEKLSHGNEAVCNLEPEANGKFDVEITEKNEVEEEIRQEIAEEKEDGWDGDEIDIEIDDAMEESPADSEGVVENGFASHSDNNRKDDQTTKDDTEQVQSASDDIAVDENLRSQIETEIDDAKERDALTEKASDAEISENVQSDAAAVLTAGDTNAALNSQAENVAVSDSNDDGKDVGTLKDLEHGPRSDDGLQKEGENSRTECGEENYSNDQSVPKTKAELDSVSDAAIQQYPQKSALLVENQRPSLEENQAQSTESDADSAVFVQQNEYVKMMQKQINELTERLAQREEQLIMKNQHFVEIETSFEAERQELIQKAQNTKDEAKRRIQKAKERVESMERQLNSLIAAQTGTSETIAQKDEIINALRSEGEKLAMKQAEMEKTVRAAKTEARGLRESLEENIQAKEEALTKIEQLQQELQTTRDDLSSARRGESQAGKMEMELRQIREESEGRQAVIITMEQQVKDLKATVKDLKTELEEAKKGAAVETEQERKKLLKEQNELVSDLEAKIRKAERDGAIREDALRNEVEELRKRWQDAVRRADSLSMDIQSSTAPLLRQLESVNKQNRARAAAWAELETQLRTELEECVATNESLSKERTDWKTKFTRLDRSSKEQEIELNQLKENLDSKSGRVKDLEQQLKQMEEETTKMKAEWAEIERLANEGVSRVRSEMTRAVVESEERNRAQLDSLKAELHKERDLRSELEKQVEGLLENAGMIVEQPKMSSVPTIDTESKPKKLRQSEEQASILANTLSGLGSDSDEEEEEDDEHELPQNSASGSFAALDQLTSSLKASKNELITLRNRLEESEKNREELVEALAESRNAKEKLPLFEAKVKELTAENLELSQEVRGLRDDIAEVRELYRTQLNILLEEKASVSKSVSEMENEMVTNSAENMESELQNIEGDQ